MQHWLILVGRAPAAWQNAVSCLMGPHRHTSVPEALTQGLRAAPAGGLEIPGAARLAVPGWHGTAMNSRGEARPFDGDWQSRIAQYGSRTAARFRRDFIMGSMISTNDSLVMTHLQ